MGFDQNAKENQAEEINLYAALWIACLYQHPLQKQKDMCSGYCKAIIFLLTLLKSEEHY